MGNDSATPAPDASLKVGGFSPWRILLLIVAAGALARLWHLDWGLPEMYEEAYPFAIAWKFWRFGEPGFTLNPDFFHYPALTFYFQYALQAIHYGVGHAAGSYADLQAFQKAYEHDPTIFIALARSLSVMFDLGGIVLLYAAASRWFGPATALLSALVMAVNPLFLMQAQLVNVDTPMTFFVLLAFYGMTRISELPAPRWYLFSGAAIGLAAASKYNGALLIAPLLLAHAWRNPVPPDGARRSGAVQLLLALAAAAALFLLLNPYILLHARQFLADVSYEQRHMATGHLGLDAGKSSFSYYLLEALPRFLGWPMFAAATAGIALGAARMDRRLLFASLFPVVYLCVIGMWEMRAERYLLPVMPFLILTGSRAVTWSWERLSSAAAGARRARAGFGGLLLLVLLAAPAAVSWSYHRSLSLPDTRTQAKAWMLAQLPDGAAIATGPFGIRIPKERFTPILIPFSPTSAEALAPFYDPRWYEDLDLLIASDYDYGRFLLEPERYRAILEHSRRLRSAWELRAEFAPAPGQNGPTVWLYRPPAVAAERFDASLFQSLAAVAETSLVVRFSENLASALFAKGKIGKCAQMLDASLTLAPGETRLVNSLAWSLFKAARYADALGFTERSLASHGGQAEMVALRGSVRLRSGDEAGAERDLRAAISLNAKLEMPYLDLELLYRKRNERENQLGILRQYLAVLPAGSENARRTEAYLRQLLEGR